MKFVNAIIVLLALVLLSCSYEPEESGKSIRVISRDSLNETVIKPHFSDSNDLMAQVQASLNANCLKYYIKLIRVSDVNRLYMLNAGGLFTGVNHSISHNGVKVFFLPQHHPSSEILQDSAYSFYIRTLTGDGKVSNCELIRSITLRKADDSSRFEIKPDMHFYLKLVKTNSWKVTNCSISYIN